MQHEDQHVEAIKKTVRLKDEVSADVFDDHVRCMGHVTVAAGKITITLDFVPSMTSTEAQRDFLLDAIRLALKACYDAKSSAFSSYA